MNLVIRVQGRVQGVFFRASTRDKARELGLTGFVRNEKDGSVYIEVFGEAKMLEEFLAWCKLGPKNAVVEDLKFSQAPDQQFSSFEIRH